MPTYLLHGFQWPRSLIRIHIILQNLEDAAAEWLVAPATTKCMLDNFNGQWPAVMELLPDLRFVEQYDPHDLTTTSQPYAYVADTVREVRLGLNIDETRAIGVAKGQREALMKLRDHLAPDQKISWFVVVCGDEERFVPSAPSSDAGSDGETMSDEDEDVTTPTASSNSLHQKQHSEISPVSTGIKKVLGSKIIRKIKSTKDLTSKQKGKNVYTDGLRPPSVPNLQSPADSFKK